MTTTETTTTAATYGGEKVTLTTAERIRVAMAEKGWTQTRLAAETGIAQADISRYCSGKRNPDGRTIDRIFKALGAVHTIDAVDGTLGIQQRMAGKLTIVNPLGVAAPVEWVVEGLVAREAVTMVAGQPGAGKSFLAQTICVGMAQGRDHVAGFKVHGRRCLVIDAENGEQLIQRRSRAIGLDEEGLPFYNVASADGFDMEKDRETLDAVLSDYRQVGTPIDLLVFDSWTSTWSGSEMSVDAVQRCLNRLRDLARKHHLGILIIHHTGKDGEDYRGSGAIAGTIEAMFTFSRPADEEGGNLRVMKCKKMRLDAEPDDRFFSIHESGISAAD